MPKCKNSKDLLRISTNFKEFHRNFKEFHIKCANVSGFGHVSLLKSSTFIDLLNPRANVLGFGHICLQKSSTFIDLLNPRVNVSGFGHISLQESSTFIDFLNPCAWLGCHVKLDYAARSASPASSPSPPRYSQSGKKLI